MRSMTNAFVYSDGEGFCVLYTHAGEVFDHADGFDDEFEAVEAARRGVYGIGTVQVGAKAPWEAL